MGDVWRLQKRDSHRGSSIFFTPCKSNIIGGSHFFFFSSFTTSMGFSSGSSAMPRLSRSYDLQMGRRRRPAALPLPKQDIRIQSWKLLAISQALSGRRFVESMPCEQRGLRMQMHTSISCALCRGRAVLYLILTLHRDYLQL